MSTYRKIKDRTQVRKRNKERWRENLPYSLWRGAKQRAAKRGLAFNITVADIVIPSHCPILDIELQCNDGKPGASSPSLDRVDPELGYVKNNVRVISFRANTLKNNMTRNLVERLYKYVFESQGPE